MYFSALVAALIVFYKFEGSHWVKDNKEDGNVSSQKNEEFVNKLGEEKHKYVKVNLGNYGS